MQDKSDWLLELVQKYKRETSTSPVFISDWDVVNEKSGYPRDLIAKALGIHIDQALPYTFSDEQFDLKELVIQQLSPSIGLNQNQLDKWTIWGDLGHQGARSLP